MMLRKNHNYIMINLGYSLIIWHLDTVAILNIELFNLADLRKNSVTRSLINKMIASCMLEKVQNSLNPEL